MAEPVRAEPLGRRAVRGSASVTLAGSAHGVLALLFLAAWHSMIRDVTAPEPIAVEVVDHMPGLTKPPPPAAPPAAPPATPAEPPGSRSPPPTASEMDRALKPALLEPPPEAKPAAATTDQPRPANRVTDPEAPADPTQGSPTAQAATPPAPPRPAPTVLTSSAGDESVPPPAPERDAVTPPPAGDPASTSQTATARLAAALPMASMPMPLSFRATLAAQGDSDAATFRGSVFGALTRARQSVMDEARTRRLTGQVVLALLLTTSGAIESLKVIQSSGSPEADAFAIAMVRGAGPFPPPPPGAPRSFTPAISFGSD